LFVFLLSSLPPLLWGEEGRERERKSQIDSWSSSPLKCPNAAFWQGKKKKKKKILPKEEKKQKIIDQIATHMCVKNY